MKMKDKYTIDLEKPIKFLTSLADNINVRNVHEFNSVMVAKLNEMKDFINNNLYSGKDIIDNLKDNKVSQYTYYLNYEYVTLGFVKFLFYAKKKNKLLIQKTPGIGMFSINKMIHSLMIVNSTEPSEAAKKMIENKKLQFRISEELDNIANIVNTSNAEDAINYAVSKLENLVNYIVDIREDDLKGYKIRTKKEFCEYYNIGRTDLDDMIRENQVKTVTKGDILYIVDIDESIYRLKWRNRGL